MSLIRVRGSGTYFYRFVASAVTPAGRNMLLGGLESRLAGFTAVAAASYKESVPGAWLAALSCPFVMSFAIPV